MKETNNKNKPIQIDNLFFEEFLESKQGELFRDSRFKETKSKYTLLFSIMFPLLLLQFFCNGMNIQPVTFFFKIKNCIKN